MGGHSQVDPRFGLLQLIGLQTFLFKLTYCSVHLWSVISLFGRSSPPTVVTTFFLLTLLEGCSIMSSLNYNFFPFLFFVTIDFFPMASGGRALIPQPGLLYWSFRHILTTPITRIKFQAYNYILCVKVLLEFKLLNTRKYKV